MNVTKVPALGRSSVLITQQLHLLPQTNRKNQPQRDILLSGLMQPSRRGHPNIRIVSWLRELV
jgi:hypothetical protein